MPGSGRRCPIAWRGAIGHVGRAHELHRAGQPVGLDDVDDRLAGDGVHGVGDRQVEPGRARPGRSRRRGRRRRATASARIAGGPLRVASADHAGDQADADQPEGDRARAQAPLRAIGPSRRGQPAAHGGDPCGRRRDGALGDDLGDPAPGGGEVAVGGVDEAVGEARRRRRPGCRRARRGRARRAGRGPGRPARSSARPAC